MEQHKSLDSGYVRHQPLPTDNIDDVMDKSWAFTTQYYSETIDRIRSTSLDSVTPDFFFREYLWVVHATGFSSHAVTKFFPKLQEAWGPVASIQPDFDQVKGPVLAVCNNPLKAKSVHSMAMMIQKAVNAGSWTDWIQDMGSSLDKLATLPYIGKITALHLARNIGNLQAVKPDLHLVRLAAFFKYESAAEMVGRMSDRLKIEPGIADLALWYYLATFGSQAYKQEGER